MTTVSTRDTVYVVSRNPYTRLLSLYLDKVLRCFGVGANTGRKRRVNCDHDLLSQSGAFPDEIADVERKPKNAPSFATFVKLVEEATERYDLCQVDHHLCLQSQGCLLNGARRLRLLRLEHMQSWFPCLNRTLGLTFLEDDVLAALEAQPCFYGDCGGAEGSNVGAVHPTGASDRVGEFYDDKRRRRPLRLYPGGLRSGYPTAPRARARRILPLRQSRRTFDSVLHVEHAPRLGERGRPCSDPPAQGTATSPPASPARPVAGCPSPPSRAGMADRARRGPARTRRQNWLPSYE